MRKLFYVLTLLLGAVSFKVQAATELDQIQGKWESKYLESFGGKWMTRSLEVDKNNITLVMRYYESATSKAPYFERVLTGTATVKPNMIDSKIKNLDIDLTKSTALILKNIPDIKALDISNCAKLNVPMDVIANGCGTYKKQKGAKKVYLTYVLQESNSMLLGGMKPFPLTEKQRPIVLLIYSLVKKNG